MNNGNRVLVYGGSGLQGQAIVQRLRANGRAIRVLTRRTAAPSIFDDVETAKGDFDDADSLLRASEGAVAIVLLLPLMFDVKAAKRWTTAVVRAAERAGVQKLVFNASAPVPDALTGIAAIDVKVAAEAIIRSAQLRWTIVRPTIYLGNLLAPWSAPAISEDRAIAYPIGPEIPVSWLSWEDTAAAVLSALNLPGLSEQSHDIAGHTALRGNELAAAFSRSLGVVHSYNPIALPTFEAGLNAAFGAPVGTEIAKLYGWLGGDGRELLARKAHANKALGLNPAPVEDWIAAQNWSAAA